MLPETAAAGGRLVVGFDVDMTLVDSADAIVAGVLAAGAAYGVAVDETEVRETLGLPLELVLPRWLPDVPYEESLAVYRAHFGEHGVARCRLLPGAVEALDAVRRHGGDVVVATARHEPMARRVLETLGLQVDVVGGEMFGPQKSVLLREHGAQVYVGDHVGDVEAAHGAGAVAVAVPTGPTSADALRSAGAAVVLDDLLAFPAWLDAEVLDTRLARLDAQLRDLPGVMVAYSGGADSAFLLAAAVRALGPDRVVAATAVSGSLASSELDPARALAASLGVRHLEPGTHELEREGYVANGADRCAFCKAELLDVLGPMAAAELGGGAVVVTGTNADDVVAGFRPGLGAAAARGALTPLADAGLTKAQVRAASAAWGLPTATKPALACLASRIAYGVPVTADGLARVDVAEAAVRRVLAAAGLEVVDLRVRDLGDDRARVDVDGDLVPQVTGDPLLLATLVRAVGEAGFLSAAVDPRGFRSGSMNDVLRADGDS